MIVNKWKFLKLELGCKHVLKWILNFGNNASDIAENSAYLFKTSLFDIYKVKKEISPAGGLFE